MSSKDHAMHCFIYEKTLGCFSLQYLIVNLLTKLYFLRRCQCNHKPTESDLKESVAETQRIVNETQRMVKVGSKWLKALFEAHLEENHGFGNFGENKDDDFK